MWRPEGWDELEAERTERIASKNNMPLGPSLAMMQSFEAGADAILEALRKMGSHFIPDEVKDVV